MTTTDVQQASQAIQEDKIVKLALGGRSWRVNGLSEGTNGWVARISHPDYPESRVETLEGSEEFSIYTQAQYRKMVDMIREGKGGRWIGQ